MKHLLVFLFAAACLPASIVTFTHCEAGSPPFYSVDQPGGCGKPDGVEGVMGAGTRSDGPFIGSAEVHLSRGPFMASAQLTASDVLNFAGSGQATLRIRVTELKIVADFYGSNFLTVNGVQDKFAGGGPFGQPFDYTISLGQNIDFAVMTRAQFSTASDIEYGTIGSEYHVLSLALYDGQGIPMMATCTSAEGWVYPLILASDSAPAIVPEPRTFWPVLIWLMASLVSRYRQKR